MANGTAPAKQATPAKQPAVFNAAVKTAADNLVGQPPVGAGECYDLADKVLTDAKAQSAPSFTQPPKGVKYEDADYVWGSAVGDLKLVLPGDILQFRNHKFEIRTETTTKTTNADGSWKTWTDTKTEKHQRPHHTAIVSSVDGNGKFTVVEQHVVDPATGTTSSTVRKNSLITHGSTTGPTTTTTVEDDGAGGQTKTEVTTKVTITVSGTIKAYRPK